MCPWSAIAILLFAELLTASPVFAAPTVHGVASWYGARFEGKRMADGCLFRAHKLTAASPYLPIGAWVRVRDRRTHRSVIVPIEDRGPWIDGRMIDLSEAAAERIGMHEEGLAAVDVEVIARAKAPPCR